MFQIFKFIAAACTLVMTTTDASPVPMTYQPNTPNNSSSNIATLMASATGPFDTYYTNGLNCINGVDASNSNCRSSLANTNAALGNNMGSAVTYNTAEMFFINTSPMQTFVIYYGDFSSGNANLLQKAKLEDFIAGISTTSYWTNVVQSYKNGANTATYPSFKTSISIPCSTSVVPNQVIGGSTYGGCNLQQYQEQIIVDYAIANYAAVRTTSQKTVYVIIGGSNVAYTMQDTRYSMAGTSGQICGTHSIVGGSIADFPHSFTLPYMFISANIPTFSPCNVLGYQFNGVLPNDVVTDAVISVLLHELAETVISPSLLQTHQTSGYLFTSSDHKPDTNGNPAFADGSLEPGEKCSNVLLGIGTGPRNANIQVSGSWFLVYPFYKYAGSGVKSVCAMQ